MGSIVVGASTGISTTSRKFSQMKREVVTFITGDQEDPDLNDLAGFGINSGIDRINMHNFVTIIKRQDITLAASTGSYTLNSDVRRPAKCLLLDSNGDIVGELPYMAELELDDESNEVAGTGDPGLYTVHLESRLFVLEIAPSAGFVATYPTVQLKYHFRQTHLATPGETIGYPTEFEQYLMWHAKYDVAAIKAPMRAALALQERDRTWRELVADDGDTTSDGEY